VYNSNEIVNGNPSVSIRESALWSRRDHMNTREMEASFAEDLRRLLNVKLKATPDRQKAELFGISPASIVNYKKEVGGRTPRGAQAKLFAEAIAFAKAWAEDNDIADSKWELFDDFHPLRLWEDLQKHISALRERLGGPHVDELCEKMVRDLAAKAMREVELVVKQMGENENSIDEEILKQQMEKDEETLWLLRRKLGYTPDRPKGDDDLSKRKEQVSRRAGDFFALIEEPLRSTFEEHAVKVIDGVLNELQAVLYKGRKDSRAQFEDRIVSLMESLEQVKIVE
jgi:hypothetical protein